MFNSVLLKFLIFRFIFQKCRIRPIQALKHSYRIAVGDRMFLGMQDFDFAQI